MNDIDLTVMTGHGQVRYHIPRDVQTLLVNTHDDGPFVLCNHMGDPVEIEPLGFTVIGDEIIRLDPKKKISMEKGNI